MHRRGFLAGTVAVAAAVPAMAHAGGKSAGGKMVSIRGRLRRVAHHYYVLDTRDGRTDPDSRSLADWPATSIRVYPKDADRMADGLVTVRGRLYAGRQQDVPTGTVASMMMADAVLA
ncbi:MAG: hypothetical protein GC145_06790 [Caulobacter sp.]|nr:hypothetical protein [Caulobacter sp.]